MFHYSIAKTTKAMLKTENSKLRKEPRTKTRPDLVKITKSRFKNPQVTEVQNKRNYKHHVDTRTYNAQLIKLSLYNVIFNGLSG